MLAIRPVDADKSGKLEWIWMVRGYGSFLQLEDVSQQADLSPRKPYSRVGVTTRRHLSLVSQDLNGDHAVYQFLGGQEYIAEAAAAEFPQDAVLAFEHPGVG
jgi:hypothetical protein